MKRTISILTLLPGATTLWAQEAADSLVAHVEPLHESIYTVNAMGDFNDFGKQVLLPILVSSFPFVAAVLIVFFVLRYKAREKKARYELIQKAIDAGVQLPDNLLAEPPKQEKYKLSYSISPITIGLAIFVALWVSVDIEVAVWGLIPVAIGLGNLITYLLHKKQEEQKNKQNE